MRIITNSLRCLLRAKRANGTWPRNGHRKGQGFQGLYKETHKVSRRYWAAIIAVMIFAAVSTVFSVAGPKVMGKATTALAEDS